MPRKGGSEANHAYWLANRERLIVRQRKYYYANLEKNRARAREYYWAHHEEARAKNLAYNRENRHKRRDYDLRRNFGITLEVYNQILSAQGGGCALCGRTDHQRVLNVDHDHRTGAVRGLLCSSCNRALGRFGDDAAGLRRALAYVEGTLNLGTSHITAAVEGC